MLTAARRSAGCDGGSPRSTAGQLVRKPVEPLLVVKQSPHDACRRLLVAVDFSPSSLLAASLLGSVTRHVLKESQGDVLVSRAPPLLDERAG